MQRVVQARAQVHVRHDGAGRAGREPELEVPCAERVGEAFAALAVVTGAGTDDAVPSDEQAVVVRRRRRRQHVDRDR